MCRYDTREEKKLITNSKSAIRNPQSAISNPEMFLFGASTAPYAKAMEWPMEEWERDLENMRELNFNTARIFAAWDRIERTEGQFDFSKQDYFIKLAEKHGIKAIINMGGLFRNPCGCYQPRWLIQNYKCHVRQKEPGVEASMPNRICPDDPIHLEKAFAFMRKTVERYSESGAVVAWMIWNEPDRREPCYCEHTLSLFREWLESKYGELAELNRLWGTESPVDFERWEDVTTSGVPTLNARRDWLLFNQYRLYETMSRIDRLVAECDPMKRPTTANLVYHHTAHEAGQTGAHLGLDVGRVGQAMSIMGVSCYTIAHPFDVRPPYETAYKLSRLRSASRDPDRRMLVLETEGGPFVRMITDKQRKLRFYHLIGHNAKSIIVWNYRSRISDGQVGYFNLMKWDGSINRRARSIGRFAGILQRHVAILNNVQPERVAAVLTTEEQQVLSFVTHGGNYADVHESRFGAFKMLWDRNIPTDCIAENNLDEMGRYKLILLPMVENMTAELAQRLRDYVAEGGTLIAESPFAFKDGDNMLQYRSPGFGLDEVFGGWTSDREGWETATPIKTGTGLVSAKHLPGCSGKLAPSPFLSKVHFFWHEFTLAGGEILAGYAPPIGTPAVIANNFGKGRAVLAGTEVFRQYIVNEQPAMTDLLHREMIASGAKPTAQITGERENVEVCRLTGSAGLLYLVINHNEREVKVEVELADSGPWTDLETGETREMSGSMKLEPESVIAVMKAAK
jgi:beta-galactosidase